MKRTYNHIPDAVNEYFEYDPVTGVVRWKKTKGRSIKGSIVGNRTSSGYLKMMFDNKCYQIHRLVFKLMGVDLPEDKQVDHINRNRTDNRWDNLRIVDQSQNNFNTARGNKTPGVTWRQNRGKWVARVGQNYLGIYFDKEDAVRAVESWKKEHELP